ncbi:hypothetical protein DM02DRAFT_633897 [Periconia macrospinosa]|uniref:Uncharacterized protein n=1 Tax=Periconia macrospinosa TaxID=97972 RepID=A0A2V1D840_9PLEO|nr:hypothetical protein DM02DRAFT_633897 [Periconia macrospinosa]
MANNSLLYIFECVRPVRTVLLQMLRPFEISSLLLATGCQLSREEIVYMNYLDDVFEDTEELHRLTGLGLRVLLFGSDLRLLQERLEDPNEHLQTYGKDYEFHIFAIVFTASYLDDDETATLYKCLRPHTATKEDPDDMTLNELSENLLPTMAKDVQMLSKWILCSPYVAGTRPLLPGWIPYLNTRKNINVRAYISTDAPKTMLFHMDRLLISRVFGIRDGRQLLGEVDNLRTHCHLLGKDNGVNRELSGDLVVDFISAIINIEEDIEGGKWFAVVHNLYSSNAAIVLRLPFRFNGFD